MQSSRVDIYDHALRMCASVWSQNMIARNLYVVILYRVRQNYSNQDLMERYKFNSLSAINLTRG